MKRLALIIALSFGAAFAAQAETLQCNFESDYKFSQQGRTLVFTKETSPGKRILIQDGRMVIDGRELGLSADDKARVSEFESEVRLLIPQVKLVTSEAIDIAFTALIEVSRGFDSEQNNSTVKKLRNAQVALHNSINKSPELIINDDIDEKIIEPIVTDFIPNIVGAAVKQALTIAFSGDEAKKKAFEARMDNMGKEIETKVEARAKKLEPLAQAICSRARNMDKIEDGLALRLSNKQKINLLDTKAP
jgi:Protein of unknown function (DUF2884)